MGHGSRESRVILNAISGRRCFACILLLAKNLFGKDKVFDRSIISEIVTYYIDETVDLQSYFEITKR